MPLIDLVYRKGDCDARKSIVVTIFRHRWSRCLALLVLLPYVTSALSGTSHGELYAVDVPVIDQGSEARQSAFVEAFRIVLVRVAGDRAVLSDPGLVRVLSRARDFVQGYDYTKTPSLASVSAAPKSTEPGLSGVPGPGQLVGEVPVPKQLLHVVFDDKAVDRLVRDHGLHVWGRLRPTLLVLLAIDDGGRRMLLAPNVRPEFDRVIEEVARRRALPIILPLLDLGDRQLIDFSDVWGDFADPLRQVARRYRAEVMLVGRAYRKWSKESDDEVWQLRWSLYDDDRVDRWQADFASIEAGLGDALEEAVDRLARDHARALESSRPSVTGITVHGIRSIGDYARAMAYLTSLEPIDDVVLTKVSGQAIELRLRLRGDGDYLRKVITYGDTLTPMPVDAAAADANMGFRLLP